ncbi:hypothetical protein H0H93_009095 [Arthromyces matolae]|nr:hypothetical protein H0H93_009648 [Arthromyces matolae]KAG6815748.1 hypothetical protein H0H93_009095 [Arthromyces matolae]
MSVSGSEAGDEMDYNRGPLIIEDSDFESFEEDVQSSVGSTIDELSPQTPQTPQPPPTLSATNSSAWLPLVENHRKHIDPHVTQWRGTLDTLLVFV